MGHPLRGDRGGLAHQMISRERRAEQTTRSLALKSTFRPRRRPRKSTAAAAGTENGS